MKSQPGTGNAFVAEDGWPATKWKVEDVGTVEYINKGFTKS